MVSDEHHENATYGLGYNLTLQRKKEWKTFGHRPKIGATAADRQTANEGNDQITHICDIGWYFPNFTPTIPHKKTLKQIVSRSATTLAFSETTVHSKNVST